MRNSSSPLSAVSPNYIDELEARYRVDPGSIDPGWRYVLDVVKDLKPAEASGPSGESAITAIFREHGHLAADLDPLKLAPRTPIATLLGSIGGNGDHSLLIERLEALYCGSLGVESAHIDDPALRAWINDAVERGSSVEDADLDRLILQQLVQADEFERFLAVKFPAKKRFGAEGAESLIPLLHRLLYKAAMAGVAEVVIGTMHRGRLNISSNVLGKSLRTLFAQFKEMHPFGADSEAAGDVPYHLGHEAQLLIAGRGLRVTLAPNPSHLEAINPVILGRVRARQRSLESPGTVLGVLLHTDASVIAQGIVSETLQLSRLDGFATCGTVHIIVDNQIGFTTERHEARTSRHCTGQWKAIDSLILHVNGDDPRAAIRAADLAFDFRHAHRQDSVIDLVCYRRNGHNEVDEPRFTQPIIYRTIDAHPTAAKLFGARLVAAGTVTEAHVESLRLNTRADLLQAFDTAGEHRASLDDLGIPPSNVSAPAASPSTGIALDRLKELLTAVSTIPGNLSINQKLGRIVSQRALAADGGVPWPVAESLAFASLLTEGIPVRLSGQDTVRGAFSQRHLSMMDAQTGQRHISLTDLGVGAAPFEAINSLLSEYAVMGFEYGYSVERPDTLVIWEAQFGDFANGAQIITDQFLACSEEKWRQPSGLVLLLPHGLEGQGPEHSSGRLERFLQLCAQDNMQVVQPTTPANFFHLMRRQARLTARKPLVIMTPKSLLRLPAAVSALADFAPGTEFQPVIASAGAEVRRILLCSGKVAYDLERERDARETRDVAVIRLEQLYPFPAAHLVQLLKRWPAARSAWVQEEPVNLGAWQFLDRRLEAVLIEAGVRTSRLDCISRAESASPAGSFHGYHERDQRGLLERAFAWCAERPR